MPQQFLAVDCTGMANGTPPEPCVMVIFGVAGDLARSTLIPALYDLGCQGLLPEPFAVIGVARRPWNHDVLRQHMLDILRERKGFRVDVWQKFRAGLYYERGDFSDPTPRLYTALRDRIVEVRAEKQLPDNVLFHLSVPPDLYGEIVQQLAAAALLKSANGGWRRVIIEKPFGHDEATARALDNDLLDVLDEEQLYRVDHYLGKETVQNMLVFRFANPGFEPIWNHHYIDHVQITVAEAEGIGTRAGYYDSTGVVRDMLQNHLLQLLCMTAMEPPLFYDGLSLRNETLKVLQAVRPINGPHDSVLGQYGAGEMEEGAVLAYREEENVREGSTTPTFVALKLMLDTWRWAGVPFYLRTGKRLPRKVSEITLQFKPTSHLMFPIDNEKPLQSNRLTFCLQPDEGILYTFLAKQPGPDICLRPVTMNFRYDLTFGIDTPPSAYEWLLHDAMHGQQTLFPRSDWIYRAWAIVDPLLAQWESHPAPDLPNYAAGTRGPAAADHLLARDGREWLGL